MLSHNPGPFLFLLLEPKLKNTKKLTSSENNYLIKVRFILENVNEE